jgi:hypothetical protein
METDVPAPTDKTKWNHFLELDVLGSQHHIRNSSVEVQILQTNFQKIPVTIKRNSPSNDSWVASLANAYGPYVRDEMNIVGVPSLLKPLFYVASHVAEQLIRLSGLSSGAYINNWQVSTNLYAREFDIDTFIAMTQEMNKLEPDLPVIFRSLTPALHADLILKLSEAGFLMLPTRQVWITENLPSGLWRQHQDVKRDLRLEKQFAESDLTEWIASYAFTHRQFEEAIKLYQDLYRVKYTRYNADYTVAFLSAGTQSGFLQLEGLIDKHTGNLLGVIGLIGLDDVLTTPIFGYDLAAPVEWGIYRRLTLRLIQKAERENKILHSSGGAGGFKRNRGASAHTEFAAIWLNHLPHWRKLPLSTLSCMVKKIALPYLQDNAL